MFKCVSHCLDRTSPGIKRGMLKGEFRQKIDEFLRDLRVLHHYHSRVADAVEFQYTWWPDPSNNSARTQEYINVSCMTMCLK